MAEDPFAKYAEAPKADPFAKYAEPAQPQAEEWRTLPGASFPTKQVVTPDTGKPSEQRQDGAIWYGDKQGNTGKPGWFDAKGNRVGSAPGKSAVIVDSQINQAQEMVREPFMAGIRKIGNTQIGPTGALGVPTVAQMVPDSVGKFIPEPTNAGLYKGLVDLPVATAQFGAHLMGSNAVDPAANAVDSFYRDNFKESKSGEMLGQSMPFLATMGGSAAVQAPSNAGKVRAALQYLKGIGKGTAIGGATAPLLTPEVGVQSEADYRARKEAEAKTGALVGGGIAAVAPVAVGAIEWLGNKGANLLAGTKLGDRLGIKTTLNPKYAGAPELSAELDKAGITHTVGDITSDPKVLSYEASMARKDPRMMDLRVQQNQQATQYADKVVSDLNAAVKQEGWRGVADLEAAAQAGGKRSGEAKALLQVLDAVGDDTKQIVKASGNLELLTRKLKADQLYDKAEKIAELYGPVKPDGLVGSLKANISRLERNPAEDQTMLPYFQKILAGIEDGTQNLSFGELRRMRTALNGRIQGLSQPGAVVPDVNAARTTLGNVVNALEADLDKYAKSHSSGLRNAWKEATDFYREGVVPFKEKGLAKLLAAEDPQGLVRLFNGKNPYEQQRMFDLLEPKGRAALRASLIEDAIAAGEKTQRGAMAPTMSAARAASALEKLEANGTLGMAFKGEDKFAARGLARILRAVDKSDNIAWVPPTGEVLDRLGSAAKVGDTTVLGAAEKLGQFLNKERLFKLYTDPKGRALLIRASDMAPGSKAMNALVKNDISKFLAAKNVVQFDRTPKALPAAASMDPASSVAQNQE